MNFSTSATFFAWRPAAWLRVTGEDAANFLQGQFTNDLRGLEVKGSGAVYGLWLNVKGKVVADSFIVRGAAGEFRLGSYGSAAAVIRERLENFIIADDVVVEDVTAEWAAVSVVGDGAWGVIEEAARAMRGGFIFRGRRTRTENAEWFFPVAQSAAVRERLVGQSEVDAETMERQRIAARIAAVPTDVGPADLPGEGDLEAEAISYTKGCYLGQEVMARLKSMGQVRRRLLRVAAQGAVPEKLPVTLWVAERAVGEVRSAVSDGAGGWTGLAMLTLMHVGAGTTMAREAGGEAEVRLVDTP